MSLKDYLIPDRQAERSLKVGIAIGIFLCFCLEMTRYLS